MGNSEGIGIALILFFLSAGLIHNSFEKGEIGNWEKNPKSKQSKQAKQNNPNQNQSNAKDSTSGNSGQNTSAAEKYGVQGTDHSTPGVVAITARNYSGSGKSETMQITRDGKCKVSADPVLIQLPYQRYPASSRHIKIAWNHGAPKVWHIDRPGADRNRAESLKGIPSNSQLDRDEVPIASSREGGKGASVTYIPFSDNRGSGSYIGNALSEFCNGQAYRIVIDPNS